MSVELLDTPRFHGFRVRRQIEGKTFQEYFSLKENGKRLRGPRRTSIKRAAEERDAELARMQEKARERAAREVHIDAQGRVRGILFRMKTEKSGTRTPVFQIGIHSTLENKIVNTTVSINLHGLEGAWKTAVDFYAEHKRISKRSKAYRELLAAQPSQASFKRMVRQAGGDGTSKVTGGGRKAAARSSAGASSAKRSSVKSASRSSGRKSSGAKKAAGGKTGGKTGSGKAGGRSRGRKSR